ncbi:envelope-like protein, partial [Trifolium medium]|nr:envelope-like protein [Trifolium medium]
AFPTLLCSIILEQHPDILGNANIPYRRQGKLCLDQRLISGTHGADNVGPFVQQQAGALSMKQMIADLTETSRAL